jgi:predicted nuclease of predicted toxin-antitoxin system
MMPERAIRLLLDEDVWQGLAAVLREAGYDAVSVTEAGRKGFSDEEILAHAIAEGRAVLTHNIQDFAPLAETYFLQAIEHLGIIVARQFEKGELLRRTLALLDTLTPESLANTLRFV